MLAPFATPKEQAISFIEDFTITNPLFSPGFGDMA